MAEKQVSTVGSQPANVKHMINPAGHPEVPWATELKESLLSTRGWQNGALAQRFVDVLSVRLCASTVAPYSSKLRKFLAFCEREDVQSVPASAHTVYEYLAFLSLEGAVQPKYWMQYVAVISSMHKDLGLPTPWMESGLCATFAKSASKLVAEVAVEHPSRKPLLAEHVMQFLRAAMFTYDIKLLRAVVAVALAFLTFCRGASIMQLALSDVQVSGSDIEVRVWDEKPTKGSGVARSLSIDFSFCPLVKQVVVIFAEMQAALFQPAQPRGFLQLPGEVFPLKEGILNACMQQCVAAVRLDGVYGSALKGHSCRSGGVSALHAIGGSLPLAAARGGWKSLATIFEHYLSLEVLPSKEAFQLLGFLLPPTLRQQGVQVYGL